MQLRPLLAKFDAAAAFLQSPLLLVIRLYWGWSFAQTGWGKLMHLERTAGYFESLDIPMPKVNAVMAGGTECVGGALLALGLFARPAAVPLIFTMLVAYWTADREAFLAIGSNPDKFFAADPFLFLYASLIVLAFGPGKLSLDALLGRGGAAANKG
ncbi:MAG TPA: DoxX family protein [Lacunisphaera sp.]|nr:DoxX family protein [Lacunisphaera sp.]